MENNNNKINYESDKNLGTEKNLNSNVINSTNPNTVHLRPILSQSHSQGQGQGLNINLNLKDKNMINMLKNNIEGLEKEKNVYIIKIFIYFS